MKTKLCVKVIFSLLLCVLLLTASGASLSKMDKNLNEDEAVSPFSESVDIHGKFKLNTLDEYDLSFMCPSDWQMENWPITENSEELLTLLISGRANEFISIRIYPKPENVEEYIKTRWSTSIPQNLTDLSAARSIISGYEGYSWINNSTDFANEVSIIFYNETYLYRVTYQAFFNSDLSAVNDFIQSLSLGTNGPTVLNFDVFNIDYRYLPEADASIQTVYSICCVNDYNYNYLPCCDTKGNCTWYCEFKATEGQVDKPADFPDYGHAYMWIWDAYSRSSKKYPVGATIPEIGCIVVFDTSYPGSGSRGHVAYVTAVNSNGSITIAEQGCDQFCGQTTPIGTSTLRSYLAGYIYRDGSRPEPSAKACSGTIGVETIIDDFNFSNSYYFQTYGPGFAYTDPLGAGRAYEWGTYNGGNNYYFHWTYTRSSSQSYGKWKFSISTAGNYDIYAYIPSVNGTADAANYYLDGTSIGTINQLNYSNIFVRIGTTTRSLSAGTHTLILYDHLSGTSGKYLAFDAIKVVRRS